MKLQEQLEKVQKDLEAFRQFMQEQAGKRKQQEEEFKGYDLGGI